MISRQLVFASSIIATAVSCFTLGSIHSREREASAQQSNDARFVQMRDEMRRELGIVAATPAGTSGVAIPTSQVTAEASRQRIVAQVKEELQTEMGLLPLHLLRDRRTSFVELYSEDNFGKTNYGTAGYLGNGYFVTVKHAVVALKGDDNGQGVRKVVSVKIVHDGKEIPAKVIDAGDAEVEVDRGDWAIIKTKDLDLTPLNLNTSFGYDFAEPIFRLGNDYSKGIVVSTGYVGQKTSGGLVTCLTDGHPGVSGGGVLDQRGDLVGIPIGRMQGDYRFSFILPLRAEMLRKVPAYKPEPAGGAAPVTLSAARE